jgi:ribosome-associated toxin RatA of RatAB toxin-antitoxin module
MGRTCWILALALAAAVAACERDTFDWEQFENFTLHKAIEEQPDGSVKMSFVALVNARPEALFKALSDVEHHHEFIEDVMAVKLVSVEGNKKVVDIQNQVLGRSNEARIEWTIDEPARRMAFKTVEAKFTDNSAEYKIDGSPDRMRSRVTTVYYLRDKGGHPFPLHTLQTGIEESYKKAVQGVKRRALGKTAVVGP